MLTKNTSRSFAVLISLLVVAPAAVQAQLTRVGAAGAVRGKITATAPTPKAVARIMSSGKAVYFNDKIKSGPDGRMQVMLLDETVFTLGPDSEMVIDKFVYNPATGEGKVSARITKGVFRFVTGKIAKNRPSDMKVKLPVGTIGIRGTIVSGIVTANEATIILEGPGAANRAGENSGAFGLTNEGKTTNVFRAGFAATVKMGEAPSPAFEAGPDLLSQVNGALGTKPSDKPKKSASSSGKGGDKNAKEDSGQGAAGGLASLDGATAQTESNEENNNETNQAATDATEASGSSHLQWDSVRGQTGTGTFTGIGGIGYTCTGTCSGGSTGSINPSIQIDFGARTIGGGGSSISLVGGALNGQSTTINSVSFASLAGNATITLAAGDLSNSNFANTELDLSNGSGGIIAQNMDVNIQYNDGTDQATGTCTTQR